MDEKKKYYRLIKTDRTETYTRHGKPVSKPVFEKIYYSAEQVEKLSLETGDLLPDLQGHKTIIPNYFLDFWTPILGLNVAFTYIRYVRQVYSENQLLKIPLYKMAQMMGISIPTLRNHLDKLEEYGFICRFYEDIDLNQTEVTIKVRKTIPLISGELLNSLPKMIQKEHSNYIKFVLKTQSTEYQEVPSINEILEKDNSHDPSKIFTRGEQDPSKIITRSDEQNPSKKFTRGEHDPSKISTRTLENNLLGPQKEIYYDPSKKVTAFQNLDNNKKINNNNDLIIIDPVSLWQKILDELHKTVEPISFETWLLPTKPNLLNQRLILYCNDPFSCNWLKNKYLKTIQDIIMEFNMELGVDILVEE